jgi:membrane protease YdiL (CAAX protease family)
LLRNGEENPNATPNATPTSTSTPTPTLTPSPPVPPTLPDPWLYLVVVVFGLYVGVGSFAQSRNLPLGLWLSQIGFFVLPSILLLWSRGFRPLRFLGLDRFPALWWQQLLVLAISFCAFAAANALMTVLQILAPEEWTERFDLSRVLGLVHGPWAVVVFAAVVIGAPVAEEIVFRGILFPALRPRLGLRGAFFLQAAVFSAIHGDPVGFAPRLLLGVILGELVLFTGSLWASIFAHALNNGISTLLFFSQGPGPQSQAGPTNLIFAASLAAGSTVLGFALLALLRRGANEVLPQERPENWHSRPSPQHAKALAWGWVAFCLLGLWGLRVLPPK